MMILTNEEMELVASAMEAVLQRKVPLRARQKVAALLKRLDDSKAADEPHTVERARDEYQRDGEIEIDDGAIVSRGGDAGAYVQAWVWVADEEIEDDAEA